MKKPKVKAKPKKEAPRDPQRSRWPGADFWRAWDQLVADTDRGLVDRLKETYKCLGP